MALESSRPTRNILFSEQAGSPYGRPRRQTPSIPASWGAIPDDFPGLPMRRPVGPVQNATMTPAWAQYGAPNSPWRNIPPSAMQIPYMRYLTGQQPLAAWNGPNLPIPSQYAWNKLGTQEQQAFQGTVLGTGMTWEDFFRRMQMLAPQAASPGRANYAFR